MRAEVPIRVQPVDGRRELRAFVELPWRIYRDDAHWMPPLRAERLRHFGRSNPYFDHAEARFFLAWRGAAPVGRISAQLDPAAQRESAPVRGHFGLLEASDREAVAPLLGAAEDWLRTRGAAVSEGPYSLSINDEVGLLVDGFHRPPRMLMNHAPPWYGPALAAAGYGKAKDLLAYRFDATRAFPHRAVRMAELAAREPGLRERPLDPGDLRREMQRIIDIFNDAWADNWGFVPMTPAEIAYMTGNLKPLLQPRLVRIAEVAGEPAAMLVALPDLNTALRGLDGRLLPLGWARLLWRLKARPPREGRVLLMGVRRRYRDPQLAAGLSALLMQRLHTAAQALGMTEFELSWILEDNAPMLRLLDLLGAEPDKRYRVYRKALG